MTVSGSRKRYPSFQHSIHLVTSEEGEREREREQIYTIASSTGRQNSSQVLIKEFAFIPRSEIVSKWKGWDASPVVSYLRRNIQLFPRSYWFPFWDESKRLIARKIPFHFSTLLPLTGWITRKRDRISLLSPSCRTKTTEQSCLHVGAVLHRCRYIHVVAGCSNPLVYTGTTWKLCGR